MRLLLTDRPDFDMCLLYSPTGLWKSTAKHCRLCGKNLKRDGRDYSKELFDLVMKSSEIASHHGGSDDKRS